MGSKGWIFAAVALGLLTCMHVVLWRRLARDTALPSRWRSFAAYSLGALALLVALSFTLGRQLGLAWPAGMSLAAWLWFAFAFYALLAFGTLALCSGLPGTWARLRRRGIVAGMPQPDGVANPRHDGAASGPAGARDGAPPTETIDADRRIFLARAAAASVGIGASAIVITGHRRMLADPETPEIALPLRGLPRELDGLRVVQISDLHLGPLYGIDECALTVERVNRQRPDLIVLTGDIVDAPVAVLAAAAAPLARLRARHGVLFVTGNHEYYSGADDWLVEMRRLGMRTLVNERVVIGDAGASFDVLGMPDESAGNFRGAAAPNLVHTLAGRDPQRALLALVHRPSQAQEVVRAGAGAAVCGHTHGGQMWPFGGIVALVQPYIAGLHREGEGLVYVSRGAGFWGPPVRVLAPPELPCFVLTSRA